MCAVQFCGPMHMINNPEFSQSSLFFDCFPSVDSAVRCLILESFVGIEWIKFGSCVKALPESFVFGPLLQGLNDPIHHEDFGLSSILIP